MREKKRKRSGNGRRKIASGREGKRWEGGEEKGRGIISCAISGRGEEGKGVGGSF